MNGPEFAVTRGAWRGFVYLFAFAPGAGSMLGMAQYRFIRTGRSS